MRRPTRPARPARNSRRTHGWHRRSRSHALSTGPTNMAAANCAACVAATKAEGCMRTTDHRSTRLFIFLAGFFLTNALIGEFVGVKIFALEASVGAEPFNW